MRVAAYKIYIAIIISMALIGCNNEQPASDANTVQPTLQVNIPLTAGLQLFAGKCATCHGDDGTAGIAGAANLKTLQADSATVIKTIMEGRKAMPAFGNTLTGTEVEEVAAYIKTLHIN